MILSYFPRIIKSTQFPRIKPNICIALLHVDMQESSLEIVIIKSLVEVTVSKNLLFTEQLNMIGFLRRTNIIWNFGSVYLYSVTDYSIKLR